MLIAQPKPLQQLLNTYNSETIHYVSVTQARMWHLQDKAIFIDARELDEFQTSHIPQAIPIGFSKFKKNTYQLPPEKNQLLIVYCTLGIRSETIAEKIKKLGYTKVYNLYGGIVGWKNKSYPILNQEKAPTEKVHTRSKYWSQWLKKGHAIYD